MLLMKMVMMMWRMWGGR
jgi:hypothetical protein